MNDKERYVEKNNVLISTTALVFSGQSKWNLLYL